MKQKIINYPEHINTEQHVLWSHTNQGLHLVINHIHKWNQFKALVQLKIFVFNFCCLRRILTVQLSLAENLQLSSYLEPPLRLDGGHTPDPNGVMVNTHRTPLCLVQTFKKLTSCARVSIILCVSCIYLHRYRQIHFSLSSPIFTVSFSNYLIQKFRLPVSCSY